MPGKVFSILHGQEKIDGERTSAHIWSTLRNQLKRITNGKTKLRVREAQERSRKKTEEGGKTEDEDKGIFQDKEFSKKMASDEA